MAEQQEITIEIKNQRTTLIELTEEAARQYAKNISTNHDYVQYCRVDVKYMGAMVQLDAYRETYMEAKFLCQLM